jgi:shikimate dehydrogenase
MVSAMTNVVGVIGDPVDHSLSPLLHNSAFAHLGLDWVSLGFPVSAGNVAAALVGVRALGIRGLSVTMPHKDAAATLVDRRTAIAERLGAVNCITNADGELVGDNTDGAGLVEALRRGGHFDPRGRSCMVAGAGGAARAVIASLAEAGASEIVVVNRTRSRGETAAGLAGIVGRYGAPEEAARCDLVVNATPIGLGVTDNAETADTADTSGQWLLDPALLGPGQFVVDLVYHPAVTPWLARAREQGSEVMNGLGMLVHQAALQIELWTGFDAPVDEMWRAVNEATSG